MPAAGQEAKPQFETPAQLVASLTKYDVGILWKGQNYSDAKVAERIQAASDDMKKAVMDGKLVGAVRVENPVDLWGMFFFKTESMD